MVPAGLHMPTTPSPDLQLRLAALAFEGLATFALAAVHFGLWRQRREAFHASWGFAWALYGARMIAISMFIAVLDPFWLFVHQSVTVISALLLCWAAFQFSTGARWRPAYALAGLAAIAWAAIGVYVIRSMAVAGTVSAVLLSAVTLGTGAIFWRRLRRGHSTGATVLAWAFTLWGLHHLDYPILRAQGSGLFYGVFVDVSFIVAVAVGTLALVVGEQRKALERRTAQLEQLTKQLLHTQEVERRRISRELHDVAGQALTAAKIGLDLEGREEASALVAQALAQVRDLSELLRPRALEDLGLVPALRALADDVSRQARLEVEWDAPEEVLCPPDVALAFYRVAQEALTNVVRHAGARRVRVALATDGPLTRLRIEDDGRGPAAGWAPHLGLLGMQERMAAAGGGLTLSRASLGGLQVEATAPTAGEPPA